MNDFRPVLRFVAMSDVHVKPEKDCPELERLDKAMKYAYAYADSQPYDRLDAVYIVGDFANAGQIVEMENFKEVLYKNLRVCTQAVPSVASHEFRVGEQQAKQQLRDLFGVEPEDHRVINGFHFISVSSTNGCNFEEPQLSFARKALAEAAADDPRRPIFFFQHPHISDTVYGSINWGDDALYPVLMNYPQVIDFSGHSHAPVNDPRSVHQRYFTSHGCGSLSYFELDEFDKYYGTVPPDCDACAQFLIVEADEAGRVRILPFDVLTRQFFPCARQIEAPWEPERFVYTDRRALDAPKPYFPADARVTALRGENGLTVTFTQAKEDRDGVDYYIVRLRDERGVIVRQMSLWSGYYLFTAPETLTLEIPDLPEGDYNGSVTPVGFWDNAGEPLRFTVE